MQESMQKTPLPDRSKSSVLVIEIPEKVANTVWAVCENVQEGHGLVHTFRYPVHVEIQIEDSIDDLHTKVFCDPVIGFLQACQYNGHGNTYLVHGISHILLHIREESSLPLPFTWFSCFDCDEQHEYRRVQMRVRGMGQQGCARLRALLGEQIQQDRGKALNKDGYKMPVGGARKRKSAGAS